MHWHCEADRRCVIGRISIRTRVLENVAKTRFKRFSCDTSNRSYEDKKEFADERGGGHYVRGEG